MLFPDTAIDVLREAVWDQDATRHFEMMSGGFMWSDEGWRDVARMCVRLDNWAFRYVLGYRASLIRESPRHELVAPWEQLLESCPDWPGFREDRCAPELRTELDATCEQRMAEFDELDRQLSDGSRK